MKEIIKIYNCEYIMGLGIPTVILIGQEHENRLICQKFIVIENPVSENLSYYIRTTKIKKNDIENLSLENFINDYGLQYAENDLYHRAIQINNYKNINSFRLVEYSTTNLFYTQTKPIGKNKYCNK
ncbi:hypothetical protein SAMN05444360_102295 [Chryseobacterium carnipullorum]|uniref:hypothetical protein n=1 Tax=Chryseobacterium carnipullorum TaxID=1124835 RepID=UPI000923FA29|nr:hypothetical protein [Chryseobacterium carnipullorum]SHL55250.1 hypothetical protein SAMN05444360_102295 [Chryseobacterium carnipullorum]